MHSFGVGIGNAVVKVVQDMFLPALERPMHDLPPGARLVGESCKHGIVPPARLRHTREPVERPEPLLEPPHVFNHRIGAEHNIQPSLILSAKVFFAALKQLLGQGVAAGRVQLAQLLKLYVEVLYDMELVDDHRRIRKAVPCRVQVAAVHVNAYGGNAFFGCVWHSFKKMLQCCLAVVREYGEQPMMGYVGDSNDQIPSRKAVLVNTHGKGRLRPLHPYLAGTAGG